MTQKSDWRVSPLDGACLDQVAEIERQCFSSPWSRSQLEEELENPFSRFFVARREERVLGYISTRMILDECDIANVAVRPEERRRHVARRLLDALLACAAETGVRTVHLEVRESNVPARALYEAAGFLVVGRRTSYYEKPCEDALLMRREMEEA